MDHGVPGAKYNGAIADKLLELVHLELANSRLQRPQARQTLDPTTPRPNQPSTRRTELSTLDFESLDPKS